MRLHRRRQREPQPARSGRQRPGRQQRHERRDGGARIWACRSSVETQGIRTAPSRRTRLLSLDSCRSRTVVGPGPLPPCARTSALEYEITVDLGSEKHDAVGRSSGNSRNGCRAKAVLTDVGLVQVRIPRVTSGLFERQIANRRQRGLTGVDEMALPPLSGPNLKDATAREGLVTARGSGHRGEQRHRRHCDRAGCPRRPRRHRQVATEVM
ncbi:transposase [Streptomyces sp. NPDC005122]